VARLFQEVNTYPNKDGMQNEMDYKLYLDFVLANMYKTTNEALQYHFRMLDLHKTGRLTVFEVNYFFRPVIERLHEMKYYEAEQELPSREREKEREREKQKLLEDVVDEIFDMVKPKERSAITLKDLVDCKVGETVVGILTDVFAFLQYDQREQLMHSAEE